MILSLKVHVKLLGIRCNNLQIYSHNLMIKTLIIIKIFFFFCQENLEFLKKGFEFFNTCEY